MYTRVTCVTDSHDFDSIVLRHVDRVTCRADPVIECGRYTMFFLGGGEQLSRKTHFQG